MRVLTLNADGSFTRETKRKEGDSLVTAREKLWTERDQWAPWPNDWPNKGTGPARWEVKGDTLRFRHGVAEDTARIDLLTNESPKWDRDRINTRRLAAPVNYRSTYMFQRKDGRLLLWRWMIWDAGRHLERCAVAFERFDPSKPLNVPPLPVNTIQPADLVGTWVGAMETRLFGILTDTLVIGADRTVMEAYYALAAGDEVHHTGTWVLRPGDVFKGEFPRGVGFTQWGVKMTLQNGELLQCGSEFPVLKRVAP